MYPLISDIADWYQYNTTVTIDEAFGTEQGIITLAQDSFFVMEAWRTFSDQDNPLAFYQNNFSVEVTRGNSYNMTSQPVPQSMFGSSSYFAGKQYPWPILYGAQTNFNFTITDLSGADTNNVTIGMEGYKVPVKQWATFIEYFPALKRIYSASNPFGNTNQGQ
jgi:hypothetical protein